MKKILPLGSVVRLNDMSFLIAGYRPMERKESVVMGYILIPWPWGFLNRKKIWICPVSEIEEIVAEGYQNKAGDIFLEKIDRIERKGKDTNYREFVKLINAFKENVDNREAT